MAEGELDPAIDEPDWSRTWFKGSSWVQIEGGFGADHGEGDELRSAKVRGYDAVYGVAERLNGETAYEVDWQEPVRCGDPKQYAVIVKGFSEAEMLKVARSLH